MSVAARFAPRLLLLLALGACAPKSDVRISNLSQGLMTPDAAGQWRVYEKATALPRAPNGMCTANGERKPCVWHGIEFDFTTPSDAVEISCVATFDAPLNVVSPQELKAADTRRFEFALHLKGRKGHAAYPGYITRDDAAASGAHSVVCSREGRPVLRYSFTDQASGA